MADRIWSNGTCDRTIAEIAVDLRGATLQVADTEKRLNAARSEHQIACDRLNDLQREFDLEVEQIKREAPEGCVWRLKPVPVGDDDGR